MFGYGQSSKAYVLLYIKKQTAKHSAQKWYNLCRKYWKYIFEYKYICIWKSGGIGLDKELGVTNFFTL